MFSQISTSEVETSMDKILKEIEERVQEEKQKHSDCRSKTTKNLNSLYDLLLNVEKLEETAEAE